jgi:hypothetical protein
MTRIVVTAFLPVACVWAARHESAILWRGVALSATQTEKARQVGVVHSEKVRLLAVDVIPPTNRLLRTIGAKLGFVSSQTIGMTLRYGIFIQTDHWGDLLRWSSSQASFKFFVFKERQVRFPLIWGRSK